MNIEEMLKAGCSNRDLVIAALKQEKENQLLRRAVLDLVNRPYGVRRPKWLTKTIEQLDKPQ